MDNYEFDKKVDLLKKLRAYATTPDDDNIRYKNKIKNVLLKCPELLYALNNKELEGELFLPNGNLNIDGEWDRYFGVDSNIRPYVFMPNIQTDVKNYLCYRTCFEEQPRYNSVEKLGQIIFHIFINEQDTIDKYTGMPRHDLIGAIIREKFNWSNVFGTQCNLVSDKEMTTDVDFITRILTFELTTSNSLVKTTNNKTGYINSFSVRK